MDRTPLSSLRAAVRLVVRSAVLLALLLPFAVPPRSAQAGAPQLDKRYRDKVYKFSLPVFRGWEQIPVEAGETIEVCKLSDPKGKGGARDTFDASVTVVRVAKGGKSGEQLTPGSGAPPTPEELRERFRAARGPKDAFEACCRTGYTDPDRTLARTGAKPIKGKDDLEGRLWTFLEPSYYPDKKIFLCFVVFEKDQVEYGLRMLCGEPLQKDYEKAFVQVAKGFLFFDDKAEDVETLSVLDGVNISAKRRSQIEKSMVRGWDVVVSPKKQYVVVYNTKRGENNALAKLIAERIELIRAQLYETQFPPAKPITAVSICRVCKDAQEYYAYGGPGGSAGYWNPGSQELVFYDASASKKADADTLAVLYHEAFHQFIFYSVGEVAPHSWFNEGHGDYYAGAKFVNGKFKIEPFGWRVGTVRGAIVDGPRVRREIMDEKTGKLERVDWGNKGYTPLQDLVAFSQNEYYSYPSVSYAQGWSLIYFLREIVPANKKYAEKWGQILDTYFQVLKGAVNGPPPGSGDGPPDDGGPDGKGDGKGDGEPPGAPPTTPGGPPPAPPAGPTPPGGEPPPVEPQIEIPRTNFRWDGGEAALKQALEVAFKGIDWPEFEDAWKKATKSGK